MSENVSADAATVLGLEPGLVLLGQYELVKKLGQGGMGAVWRGHDKELDRPVALKVLPAVLAASRRAREALRSEAAQAIELSHEAIGRVYHFGVHEDMPVLVMELIEGESLADLIDRKGKLAPRRVVALLEPLARGLDFAHGRKVVHRDLKPANVLIRESDRAPVLVDFGLAAEARDQSSIRSKTGEGEISGTLAYMSPEQLKGKKPRRSMDLYSLAATAYEMLCGHPPFFRGDMGTIGFQILNEPAEPIEELPRPVNAVLLKGLAKEPEARHPSAMDFVTALKEAVEGGGGTPEQAAETKMSMEPEEVLPRESSAAGDTMVSGDQVVPDEAKVETVRLPEPAPEPAPVRLGGIRFALSFFMMALLPCALAGGAWSYVRVRQMPWVRALTVDTAGPEYWSLFMVQFLPWLVGLGGVLVLVLRTLRGTERSRAFGAAAGLLTAALGAAAASPFAGPDWFAPETSGLIAAGVLGALAIAWFTTPDDQRRSTPLWAMVLVILGLRLTLDMSFQFLVFDLVGFFPELRFGAFTIAGAFLIERGLWITLLHLPVTVLLAWFLAPWLRDTAENLGTRRAFLISLALCWGIAEYPRVDPFTEPLAWLFEIYVNQSALITYIGVAGAAWVHWKVLDRVLERVPAGPPPVPGDRRPGVQELVLLVLAALIPVGLFLVLGNAVFPPGYLRRLHRPPTPTPTPAPTLPSVKDGVGLFSFSYKGKTKGNGTGFLAEYGNQTLVLSAHHLYGEGGQIRPQLTSREIQELPGANLTLPGEKLFLPHYLYLADAGPIRGVEHDPLDLAAFVLARKRPALKLAPRFPVGGTRVRVVMPDGREYPAWIAKRSWLARAYLFQGEAPPFGSSGAPVLDEQDRVIGIHLANVTDGTRKFGLCTSIDRIRAALKGSVYRPPQE